MGRWTTCPQRWWRTSSTMRGWTCGASEFSATSSSWVLLRLSPPLRERPTTEYARSGHTAPAAGVCVKAVLSLSQVDLRFPSHVSEGARDLITKVHTAAPLTLGHLLSLSLSLSLQLLQKQPCNRLPLPEVLKHPWIRACAEQRPQPSKP